MWQRNDPDIPFEKTREVLSSEAIRHSVVNLLLTGGEPSLRKDTPEIFDCAFTTLKNLRYASMFTNSLSPRLAQETARRSLEHKERSGRDDVSFSVTLSLDGIGKTHDSIRGVEGAFGRAMENFFGLKTLSGRHPMTVNFSCLVQRANVADHGVFTLLDASEASLLPITFPIVYGKDIFRNLENAEAWSVEDREFHDEVVRFYEEAVRRSDSGGLLVDNGFYYRQVLSQLSGTPRTLPCLFRQKKACTIDSDGSVYLCDMTKDSLIGNIYEKSFDDIWSSAEKEEAHARMVKHCGRCFSSCIGSGRYQLIETWRKEGVGGMTRLSVLELRKRLRRVARLIREYRYAVIPRL